MVQGNGPVTQSGGLSMHMVGSGQNEVVSEVVVVAEMFESSVHVGFEPSGYGTSGMVLGDVTKVVAEYMPELLERLAGPTGTSGED